MSQTRQAGKSTGLTLLKKGKKGISRALFSRTGLVCCLLFLNAALLAALFWRFRAYALHFYGGSTLLAAVMVLILINSPHDPTSKITWLVIIMISPVFGSLLYLYTRSDFGHRALKKRMSQQLTATRQLAVQQEPVRQALEQADPGAASLARYLRRIGGFPVYQNTDVTYFSSGEETFQQLLKTLEQAKDFIFLEYFIVEEGEMWGQILEILARKVGEGVDVRVLYDGFCEFILLPKNYPKMLRRLGISCRVFAPITPFLSTHYNYRDHRKIAVIDGHTAFTGGVNLADEYINRVVRFGYWKDTAIMLQGEAVRSFTLMFLQLWGLEDRETDYAHFLAWPQPAADACGFVIPYFDCPLDDYRVAQQVYMDILNRAQRYVHIMTPYLILDGEMENALKYAGERGVDVRIILPGIPDKKLPYALAKTHYPSLLASGIRIYEYTPGFVHAKSFVCDDTEAVIGSINLDYRSLYHHFECAAYLHGVHCIADIEADFLQTQAQCRRVTRETTRSEKLRTKLLGALLKIIAPLL